MNKEHERFFKGKKDEGSLTSWGKFCKDFKFKSEYLEIKSMSGKLLDVNVDSSERKKLLGNISEFGAEWEKVINYKDNRGSFRKFFAKSRLSKVQKIIKKKLTEFRKLSLKELDEFSMCCLNKNSNSEDIRKLKSICLALLEFSAFLNGAGIKDLDKIPDKALLCYDDKEEEWVNL